jgi:biopolymer transport protein ExbD
MLGAAFLGVVLTFVSLPLNATPVITILLPNPDSNPPIDCDGRPVFAKIKPDLTITLNGKSIKESALRRHLDDIFQTRAERLIYFEADPHLQFKAVVSVLEQCNSVPNLTIALVTGSTQKSQCFVIPIRRAK